MLIMFPVILAGVTKTSFSEPSAGAVIGSICSILWYQLWNVFMLDFYVSYLWVRIIVVLGSAGVCLGFLLHVIYHWLKDK